MYVFSGGGYGGSAGDDGLTNGCHDRHLQDPARRGAGAALPDPVRAVRAARALGRGRPHPRRLRRRLQGPHPSRRGAVLVPDGPRPLRPARLFGGKAGAPNEVVVERRGTTYRSPHWSKDEDLHVVAGDAVHVRTPGGGGYGDLLTRDPELVRRDVARGYFTAEDAERTTVWCSPMSPRWSTRSGPSGDVGRDSSPGSGELARRTKKTSSTQAVA